jgi:hypothetical protein
MNTSSNNTAKIQTSVSKASSSLFTAAPLFNANGASKQAALAKLAPAKPVQR